MVHTFTDENFDNDVLKADRPVLVDFWAQWCGPCQAMTPIIEEITEEYDGKMLIGKMDVDANPETTQKYGIMSIPSNVLFFLISNSHPLLRLLIYLQVDFALEEYEQI